MQVPRDNVLQILETMIDGDVQLVSVEGQEGIGKTTLLGQFAKRHSDCCFSVFIRPTSRFAYDPAVLLADLCDQMSWAVSGQELPAGGTADDAVSRQLILEVQRLATRTRRRFYFVVDGLEDIPEGGPRAEDIMSLIPLGLPQFRVLVSGSVEHTLRRVLAMVRHKAVPIPFFSLDETARFFGGTVSISNEVIQEFHRAGKGVPSNLATLRRILEGGTKPNEILDELPAILPNFFEFEWRLVDDKDELQLDLLATLAHDRRRHTVGGLAALFAKNPEVVRTVLGPLTFLSVPDNDDEEVQFVSESFRKFAQAHLSGRSDSVQARAIDYLLAKPETKEALTFLPTYLQEAGRLDDLLEFLSPEHFAALMGSSQSLSPVDQKAQLGLEAALRLDRDADILRFGLERTVIAEVDDSSILQSEIEARVGLDDYEAAVAIAQRSVLKQDRLRLLARVVKLQKEKGLAPETQLVEQIAQLFAEVDASSLRHKVSDLATDLMYCRPDLAIQLVKKSNAQQRELESDWDLTKLSIFASTSKSVAARELSEAAEQIRSHIKDQTLLGFSTALPLLIGNYTSSEVLKEVAKLERPKDQLLLLRIWANHTNKPAESGDIIEHALEVGIRTVEYAPVATDLRQLARPLPFLRDLEQIRRLVGIFDSQRATVEKLGPTEDYVRLQLKLAHAESRFDGEAASRRLLEVYYFIGEIKDLEVSAACTSRLLCAIPKLDANFKLADSREVLDAATNEFSARLQTLLSTTADHYLATRNVVKALARNRPDLAVCVVKSLNLEGRRDQALLELFSTTVDQQTERIPLIELRGWLEEFADPESRDEALSRLFERLSVKSSESLSKVAEKIVPFVEPLRRISEADVQCKACSEAITILAKSGIPKQEQVIRGLQEMLSEAWTRIGDDRVRTEIGYRIASALAPYFREDAKQYLSRAEELRKTRASDAPTPNYSMCVQIAIKAFSGLLSKRFESPDDLAQLARQIERVPSDHARIVLWTCLALEYVRAERLEDCRKIVSERAKPLLDQIRGRDAWQWQQALVACAPALYQAHKSTALELMDQLDVWRRDAALGSTIDFILKKTGNLEPYKETGVEDRFQLSYEEAVDICELLERVDEDGLIYQQVTRIVNSALWKNNRSSFSQQQKADLALRLGTLVKTKLPNPRFIKHDGFKIVAEAQICRLTRPRPNPNTDIETVAQKIPNPADRAFILSAVAASDIALDVDARKKYLKEAKTLADQIPSALDRASRYELIAESAADVDPSLSKACVREAFGLLPKDHDSEIDSLRNYIVDFAHQIDPDLASELARSLDNDAARNEIRDRLAMRDLSKKIADGKIEDTATEDDSLPQAAWSLLGQLNAGRIEPLPVSETRRFVQSASSMPLSKAYPIIMWVIANAIRRRSQSNEARRLLHSMYSAGLVGCELSFRLSPRALRQPPKFLSRTAEADAPGMIVHAGQRDTALDFLRRWLAERAVDYLKICDPYFGPSDLGALQLVLGSARRLHVSILTSRKKQEVECAARSIDEEYRRKWKEISDQEPPQTDVVVVGNKTGDLPIHERWWLTKGGGLRTGSSFNSLGGRRESEITVLSEREALLREQDVDEFLTMRKREHEGEKLSIYLFVL